MQPKRQIKFNIFHFTKTSSFKIIKLAKEYRSLVRLGQMIVWFVFVVVVVRDLFFCDFACVWHRWSKFYQYFFFFFNHSTDMYVSMPTKCDHLRYVFNIWCIFWCVQNAYKNIWFFFASSFSFLLFQFLHLKVDCIVGKFRTNARHWLEPNPWLRWR